MPVGGLRAFRSRVPPRRPSNPSISTTRGRAVAVGTCRGRVGVPPPRPSPSKARRAWRPSKGRRSNGRTRLWAFCVVTKVPHELPRHVHMQLPRGWARCVRDVARRAGAERDTRRLVFGFFSSRPRHPGVADAWLLWAEFGPSKMNRSTTPNLHVAGTCEKVLQEKREPKKPFCPSFSPSFLSRFHHHSSRIGPRIGSVSTSIWPRK